MSREIQLSLAIVLRDEGIEKAENNSLSWQERAIGVIGRLSSCEMMGEDIHLEIEKEIGDPHHPNAYGALIMKAIRLGLIDKTGEYKKSSRPSSHARVNPVYFICNNKGTQS